MKRQKFEVRRTKEGTLFEIAFVVLAVIVWAAVVVMLSHAPETVPTHFGPSGQPDAYGNKLNVLFPCIVATAVGVCCMAGAYFPHTVNLPGVTMANERQAALATRLMRLLGLGLLLLTAVIARSMVTGTVLPVIVVGGLLVVVAVIFTLFIDKAK